MRITQKYTDRTYLKYNNRLLENNANSMEKIWRQKAYKRASEDSINASKAMIVRRNLRNLDVYDSNLKTADGLFKAAESNLYTLADKVYINVQTKIEQACNGTYDKDTDIKSIATEIEQFADAAMNVLNKDYAERAMFGGANNSQPPFAKTTDDVTKLTVVTYNGVPLNDIISDDKYLVRSTKALYEKSVADGDGAVTRKAYDDDYAKEITKSEYEGYLDDTQTFPDYDPESVFTKTTTSVSNSAQLEEALTVTKKDNSKAVLLYDEQEKKYYKYTRERTDISESDYNSITDAAEKAKYTDNKYVDENGDTMYYKIERGMEEIKADDYDKNPDDLTKFHIKENGDYEKTAITYHQRQYRYYEKEPADLPGTKSIFVDIGIGIKYNEKYEVDPQTALDVSLNGAAITGYGDEKAADGVTYSKNFIQQMFDVAAALNRGDIPFANATLDRYNAANKLILTEITTLGAKQNSIEFYLDKNDDYRTSLKDRQNDVEGVDFGEEITEWKANQAAYDAILQMSSKILPNSIFDFMR